MTDLEGRRFASMADDARVTAEGYRALAALIESEPSLAAIREHESERVAGKVMEFENCAKELDARAVEAAAS